MRGIHREQQVPVPATRRDEAGEVVEGADGLHAPFLTGAQIFSVVVAIEEPCGGRAAAESPQPEAACPAGMTQGEADGGARAPRQPDHEGLRHAETVQQRMEIVHPDILLRFERIEVESGPAAVATVVDDDPVAARGNRPRESVDIGEGITAT